MLSCLERRRTSECFPTSLDGLPCLSLLAIQRFHHKNTQRVWRNLLPLSLFFVPHTGFAFRRNRYLEAGGLHSGDISEKLSLFGENSVNVKQPKFWQHLMDRLTSPFVVFNLFNQVHARCGSRGLFIDCFDQHHAIYCSRGCTLRHGTGRYGMVQ